MKLRVCGQSCVMVALGVPLLSAAWCPACSSVQDADPAGTSDRQEGGIPLGLRADSAADGAPAVRDRADGGASYLEPPDPVDVTHIPSSVPSVFLDIAQPDIDALEAAPFDDVDVPASFQDAAGTFYTKVSVHYRGAYALQNLISSGAPQRNWKIKFPKNQKYQNRREWNFTYEPDLRQKIAYDLMHLAGVRLPNARHVTLTVNGKVTGAYLEYEDPDNSDFLLDQFGDRSGDLYKAAQDIPNRPRYFATIEVLGDTNEDYFFHYDKKTNDEPSETGSDYRRLRAFVQDLNTVSDAGFAVWLESHFDVPRLLSYLVVSNFISNWDGYPHRPKNFWLYEIPSAQHWVFIPWDMDATFQSNQFELNLMGTTASIFYQFDQTQPYGGHPEEGAERPLVRRAMNQSGLRAAYVDRYREALRTFLAQDAIANRVAALAQVVSPVLSASDRAAFDGAAEDIRNFTKARIAAVSSELASQP